MNWKTKTMLIYGAAGLVFGVLAGIMIINNAEKKNTEYTPSLKKGAQFGIDAINLIRKNL